MIVLGIEAYKEKAVWGKPFRDHRFGLGAEITAAVLS